MSRMIGRRDLLKGSMLAAGVAFSPFLSSVLRAAPASDGPRKKVLFFTKSQTFQHSSITRSADEPDKLAWAEQILTDLGAQNGFDVTCSKDGRVFTAENLKQYDVIVFYTTGDLTQDGEQPWNKKGGEKGKEDQKRPEPGMGAEGKAAFLAAIENGTGFIGFHSAADTFHSKGHVRGQVNLLRDINEKGEDEFDPYVKMLGGEFIVHGKQQKALLKTIDANWPGAEKFNGEKITEEWYSLKNFSPNLHVIIAQDPTGMEGKMYQRGTFPETWARMHGKGRVFYTSLGHREDIWTRDDFRALVVGALNWTSKKINADVTPNIEQATPEANPKKQSNG